ncbi:MAG: serine/threonine-protein kinase [Alphaproteobacteria bacterium]
MSEEMRHALPKGYEIEGYRIEKVLGAGGFGVTYLAHEIAINRRVAIKEYLPSGVAARGRDDVSVHPISAADRENFQWGLDRFRKEAQTLVTFRHNNIVTVYRYFEANGTAFLVMAYEDGESLAKILERAGTLTEDEINDLLGPLLDGLAHVHGVGFLHRDIKPGNIYIRRDGSPVLLDFGAARQALGGRSQSLTSIVSAGYAPFEQYTTRGNQGAWTDIYALGGVLYRATTGERPPDSPDRIRDDPYVPAVQAAAGNTARRCSPRSTRRWRSTRRTVRRASPSGGRCSRADSCPRARRSRSQARRAPRCGPPRAHRRSSRPAARPRRTREGLRPAAAPTSP